MDNQKEKNLKGSIRTSGLIIILLLIIAIVLIIISAQKDTTANKSNAQTDSPVTTDTTSFQPSANLVGEKINFLLPSPIGKKFTDSPLIANIAVTDLDKDGLLDVMVCDVKSNTVSWIRQYSAGVYSETILTNELTAPAHVQVYDFDNDGDNDLLVAVLGYLYPSNDKIGSVIVLENDGRNHFAKHVVAEKIARATDVRAGDLDGDGDMDLAVAQFGFSDGETRWIENLGKWKFESHILQSLSGPINVILSDVDKDGDQDIVSIVSQEFEEVYCFVNDGKGHFTPTLLWGSSNEDFGSSSIYMYDMDGDGDDDILYTNGDSFNYQTPAERPWHGVQWLENKGALKFEFHRICDFVGAYNCRPADIDNDGDVDLFAISAFNNWDKPEAQSFIWLENLGNMQFKKRAVANTPTHLITLDQGDFNKDGMMDFVTGGLHMYPPYNRMGRVTLWLNNGSLSKK